MTLANDFEFTWDKDTDTVYLLKNGFASGKLANVYSEKVPGIIKRIDRKSGMCVGFIIECFSRLFPGNIKSDEANIKGLLVLSIAMTNELSSSLQAA